MPATDGGFLQIMMATRGNTEIERLVLQERLTAIDNISQELKNLKTRYGELVGEDVLGVAGRRLGFGTVEETVSLRKKGLDQVATHNKTYKQLCTILKSRALLTRP